MYRHEALGLSLDHDLTVSVSGAQVHRMVVRKQTVLVLSDSVYGWTGQVYTEESFASERFDDVQGEAHFVVEDGHLYGSLRVGDEHYRVSSLGDGSHALVRLDGDAIPDTGSGASSPFDAGGGQATSAEHHDPAGEAHDSSLSCTAGVHEVGSDLPYTARLETGAGRCPIERARVLVLYTQAAHQRMNQMGMTPATVRSALALEASQVYGNSGITGYQLIIQDILPSPMEEIGYNTGQIDEFMDDLVDNSAIQAMRQASNADIVVLLTQQGWFGQNGALLGRAHNILTANQDLGEASQDAFSMVEMGTALAPEYTFLHEVGHLQGARHHPNDDPPLPPGVAFGYPDGFGHRFSVTSGLIFKQTRYYRTIMAYRYPNGVDEPSSLIEHTKIPYFSSPYVSYQGRPTGIMGQRDNARVLQDTAPIVADFVDANELSASASGGYTTGTSDAWFQSGSGGGTGQFSYAWQLGTHPGSYGAVVSTAPGFQWQITAGSTWYAKLTITTSSGQQSIAYTTVHRPSGDCGPNELCPCEIDDPFCPGGGVLAQEEDVVFLDLGVYPNPSTSELNVAYQGVPGDAVEVRIYDATGRLVHRTTSDSGEGANTLPVDVSRLAAGTYYVRMIQGQARATRSFSIVR